eukprot:2182366-Karenia_brevis.AAC.1
MDGHPFDADDNDLDDKAAAEYEESSALQDRDEEEKKVENEQEKNAADPALFDPWAGAGPSAED